MWFNKVCLQKLRFFSLYNQTFPQIRLIENDNGVTTIFLSLQTPLNKILIFESNLRLYQIIIRIITHFSLFLLQFLNSSFDLKDPDTVLKYSKN